MTVTNTVHIVFGETDFPPLLHSEILCDFAAINKRILDSASVALFTLALRRVHKCDYYYYYYDTPAVYDSSN